MLTFPGAEDVVNRVYAQLKDRYPAVPADLAFGDEPSGDFGVAHAYFNNYVTFDDNHVPALYVICHEVGHEIDYNVCKKRGGTGFTNGLYDEFWAVRNFTGTAAGTPWDAQLRAIAHNTVANPNAGYRYWPAENFADAFGAVNSFGVGTLITEQYNAYLDEAKLRAFYASLEGVDMAITDADVDRIASAVALKILPDVLQKLNSGFNTSVTTFLDRLAHGDKKVETAEIDA
jgi:hypothetical protein